MTTRFGSSSFSLSSRTLRANRGLLIGGILFIALIAFEIFNFDTTQFALENLLGDVNFLRMQWATILAIAFCAIDFAGLNRLFTPEGSRKEEREVWFLMGAWLLGATLNAVMTWWAVSVTLLNNNLGNEVLSREQILRYVPIFVAILVWLTRILFIGSFSVAGHTLLGPSAQSAGKGRVGGSGRGVQSGRSQQRKAAPSRIQAAPKRAQSSTPMPSAPVQNESRTTPSSTASRPINRTSRVKQRPPVPNAGVRQTNGGIQARVRR